MDGALKQVQGVVGNGLAAMEQVIERVAEEYPMTGTFRVLNGEYGFDL